MTNTLLLPPASLLQIDVAAEQDAPLILELIRDLADHENITQTVFTNEDTLRATLFGPHPAAEVLLARRDSSVVGMATFFMTYSSMLGKRCIYLDDLYVRPEWRGQGVGRVLLRRLARIAASRNCGRVEWIVLNCNEPAISFYRGCGATLMHEWTKCRLNEEAINALSQTSD